MSLFPTFKIKVDGINLNYVKVGQGPSLVFIHGWANNWEGWIPMVKYLKNFFTLYLIDLPGFGRSGNLAKYSIETNSGYVASFIKKLSLHPPAVIGLSMGSFVVTDLARRYNQYFQSAILLGPLLKSRSDSLVYKIVPYYLRIFNRSLLSRKILKSIIASPRSAYFVSKYFNMYRFNKEFIDKYGTRGRKLMRIEAFIDMGLSANSYDLKNTLLNIKTPTLMIYGREDKIASYNIARELLSQNKNLKLKVIPFAGHMVHWEQTEKAAEAICNFLTLQGFTLRG